ncbi:MAG: hypothetical protein V7727_20140 [Sneathiella sp.]
MKDFTKIDLAVGIVAIVTMTSAVTFALFPGMFDAIRHLTIRPEISVGEIAMAVATIGILIFAGVQVLLMKQNHAFETTAHQAKYQLALFEQRAEVFAKVEQLIFVFVRDSDPSNQVVKPLAEDLQKNQYILPPDQLDYANLAVRNALSFVQNNGLYATFCDAEENKGVKLDESQKQGKDLAYAALVKLSDWFIH